MTKLNQHLEANPHSKLNYSESEQISSSAVTSIQIAPKLGLDWAYKSCVLIGTYIN